MCQIWLTIVARLIGQGPRLGLRLGFHYGNEISDNHLWGSPSNHHHHHHLLLLRSSSNKHKIHSKKEEWLPAGGMLLTSTPLLSFITAPFPEYPSPSRSLGKPVSSLGCVDSNACRLHCEHTKHLIEWLIKWLILLFSLLGNATTSQ